MGCFNAYGGIDIFKLEGGSAMVILGHGLTILAAVGIGEKW